MSSQLNSQSGAGSAELQLPIFVVSLMRAENRKKHVAALFSKYELKYEIVEAVDKRNLTDSDWATVNRELAFLTEGQDISPGHVACHLSHIKVWKEIQRRNLDFAFVMEDDIAFDERFARLVKGLKQSDLPRAFDIINFHSDTGRTPTSEKLGDLTLATPTAGSNRTTCLLLSRKAIETLLINGREIFTHIDGLTGEPSRGKCMTYLTDPQIVSDCGFASEIWARTSDSAG